MGLISTAMGAVFVCVAILAALDWSQPFADVWMDALLVLLLLTFALAIVESIVDWIVRRRGRRP